MVTNKRLSDSAWHLAGDSVSLSEIDNKEVTVLKYVVINTRFGEAVIMRVAYNGIEHNVITSSTRIRRALETNDEFPVVAKFCKVEGKWTIE